MKTILPLLIVLSFCSISFGQWTNQTSGTIENLNAVQFVNSNIGYVVGNSGTILKTVDSGLNWTLLNSNITIPLNSIFFVDNDTGYVSGSYYNQNLGTKQGVLLKTIDGGINWINLNFPFEENLSDVFFLNSTIGFAACLSDGLFKTVDGGVTWNLVKSKNTQKVFFPSASIGYSIDNNSYGTSISKTTNGGLNWTQIKDDNSPDYNTANILGSIFFTSDSTGYFGSEYYGGLYSTISGGSSLDYVIGIATFSIHFPTNNIGYAITNFGGINISQTTDAGLNWNNVHTSNLPLSDIFFSTNSNGWAVGEQGTILNNKNVALGINNKTGLDNQIFIFPNPSNNLITITAKGAISIFKLSFYNSLGVLTSDYNSSQKTIDISKLPQGVYFLKIETNKGIVSKKIIKN